MTTVAVLILIHVYDDYCQSHYSDCILFVTCHLIVDIIIVIITIMIFLAQIMRID